MRELLWVGIILQENMYEGEERRNSMYGCRLYKRKVFKIGLDDDIADYKASLVEDT